MTDSMSSLTIPADLKKLAVVRRFVHEKTAALGVDPDVAYDVVLAVEEVASNVIIYGYYDGRRQDGVEIEVGREGDALLVRIRDRAALFDPNTVPAPDLTRPLEERPMGGMGIYLIKQLVDEVIHRARPQGGNELTLVKRGVVRDS